jgi:hypothetical protein
VAERVEIKRVQGGARVLREVWDTKGQWEVEVALTHKPEAEWLRQWEHLQRQSAQAADPIMYSVSDAGQPILTFTGPREAIPEHIRFIDRLLSETNGLIEERERAFAKSEAEEVVQQAGRDRERELIQRELDAL